MATNIGRFPIYIIAMAALAGGTIGCGPEEESADRVLEPEPEWTACEADEECVLIEVECCDHCNGGRAVAVNQAYQQEALDAMRASCGPVVSCTEIGCPPEETYCDDSGQCAYRQVVDCSLLDEAACNANEECVAMRGTDCSTDADVYGGCMSADQDCGQALTCAVNPANQSPVIFPNTCVPSGWGSCGGACP